MSRVDVIIPCYKYAHFLRACVESVLTQTVDVRILILDDASPDNTQDVARELAAHDSRIEFRRHTVNQGHIETFNEGLDWARSDYTLLISADDLLTPGALSRAVAFLDAHPNVGFAYGRAVKFTSGDALPDSITNQEKCGGRIYPGVDWLKLICEEGGNVIYSPEVVVRTQLQKKLGNYRPDLPHTSDLEMWLRFAANADVGVLNADQAFYRIHSHNMHCRQFGQGLTDWYQRRAAFEILFQTYGSKIDLNGRLRGLCARSLAWEAIWAARRAYDLRDLALCRDLLNFSVDTCRKARWWKAYIRTSLMLSVVHRVRWEMWRRGVRKTPYRPVDAAPVPMEDPVL